MFYDYAIYIDTRGSTHLTLAHDLTSAIAKDYSRFLTVLEGSLHPYVRIKLANIDTDHGFCSLYRLTISVVRQYAEYESGIADLVYKVLHESVLYNGLADPGNVAKVLLNKYLINILEMFNIRMIDDDYISRMKKALTSLITVINDTHCLITTKKFWSADKKTGKNKEENKDDDGFRNDDDLKRPSLFGGDNDSCSHSDDVEKAIAPSHGKLSLESLTATLATEYNQRFGYIILRPALNGRRVNAVYRHGAENQLLKLVLGCLPELITIRVNTNNLPDRAMEIHSVDFYDDA